MVLLAAAARTYCLARARVLDYSHGQEGNIDPQTRGGARRRGLSGAAPPEGEPIDADT